MEKENQLIKNFENSHATIEVPQSVDFVYIMRKDSAYVAQRLANAVAMDGGPMMGDAYSLIHQAYEGFTNKLTDTLASSFGSKGNIEIHMFEAEPIEEAEFAKAGVLPIVSLDPLLEDEVTSFCVSRGFYKGGIEDFGQIARPGSEDLELQAARIAQKFGNCPVCVVEDDIFSGGSVINALEHLGEAGVKIAKLIPGFQIGKPTKLDAMGINVDPVFTYKTADNTDIFLKVDLGDPRDYLMGASGLVVKLSDGSFGRVPYVLPFVSTSARASVPKEHEVAFALEMWQHNQDFFRQVEQKIGKPVLLKHMDPYFLAYAQTELGIIGDTPMIDLASQAFDQTKKL